MNTQTKIETQMDSQNESQTTKPNTTIVDTTPILSRRKKRRISSGW